MESDERTREIGKREHRRQIDEAGGAVAGAVGLREAAAGEGVGQAGGAGYASRRRGETATGRRHHRTRQTGGDPRSAEARHPAVRTTAVRTPAVRITATATGRKTGATASGGKAGPTANGGKAGPTANGGETVPPPTAAKPVPVGGAAQPVAPKAEPAKPAAAATPAAKPLQPAAPPPAAPKIKPVTRDVLAPDADVGAVLSADHRDPFAFLGMHAIAAGGPLIVRTFQPKARVVAVIDAASGRVAGTLERIRDEGFFAGTIEHSGEGSGKPFAYRLRITRDDGATETVADAYAFPPVLSDADAQSLAEGSLAQSYACLGAHPATVGGVAGATFAVWAPKAGRVAVIGAFNGWDGRCHGMRLRHDCGVWEIFVPGVAAGDLYKYEIKAIGGERLADKCDPYAFRVEPAPGTAAIVCDLGKTPWTDRTWMAQRKTFNPREGAIAIYEVHLASWRRRPEEGHRCLTYRELAETLVDYVEQAGFTHVQLLPVGEYDADASLGYQPFAPFAPTSRWGAPEDFAFLIDRCHRAGIGVILDWVPNQFSGDPHGLAAFDGSHLYEHPDPQRRHHPGSDALVYDFGRREVANYLLANAAFWLDRYHVDGLKIGGLPALLYLDYGRSRGEWTPNRNGGHENLDAVDFLRRFNEEMYGRFPGIFTVAEDNSAWPRVSHPTFLGGLGFGFRWNLPWVRDTIRYMSRNPVHRKYYHDELMHGPATAFQENYILPLAHDEVAYGRGSLLRRMPGDRWQRFANLRAYYALMYAHPGKKLMFMGDEFAQEREWNAEISLDWHLLDDPMHRGVQTLIADLNRLYRTAPALHQLDCEPEGFAWIDCNDSDQSVISFVRRGRDDEGTIVCVCNFTPVVRPNYRIGVPEPGHYAERLNTDAEAYGGSNAGNDGGIDALPEPMHGRPYSLSLKLPPFSTVILQHRSEK